MDIYIWRQLHNTVYFQVSLTISLDLSLGHLSVISLVSVKRWPSGKVKENCEINLKVHCVMLLSLSYEVRMYLDGIRLISFYSQLVSQYSKFITHFIASYLGTLSIVSYNSWPQLIAKYLVTSIYRQITAASDWSHLFMHPRYFCVAYIHMYIATLF